jgi:hypothetical protein
LEEWHRYSLPPFTERMWSRLRSHCEDGHQSWPVKGRYTRHTAEVSRRMREDGFAADSVLSDQSNRTVGGLLLQVSDSDLQGVPKVALTDMT